MSIRTRPANSNYRANFDTIFPKKSKKTKTLPLAWPLKTIEQLDRQTRDKTILERARKALETIELNPKLATNPVVMMAVDHIHEELDLVNKDLDSIDDLVEIVPLQTELLEEDIRREYSPEESKKKQKASKYQKKPNA